MNSSFFSSMKPFQIALLLIFGFLAVLGLVLFANFGGFSSSSASVGTVTIWGTLPQSSMDVVLNQLRSGSQEYAGISYVQRPEATFDTDLAEAIATGNGPDLVLISQELLPTEQNKLSVIPFSTISQRTYLDTYLPIDELFLAADGTYGIPFAVDPLVMYYNRRTLINAGIATPPSTWEAILGSTESLTQSSAGVVSESTIPFGVYDNVENARAILSLLFLQSGNGIVSVGQNGPHAELTDSSSSKGNPAASALTFYTQFADPVKTVYTWNRSIPSARAAFLGGTLAFYPGFASELTSLSAANPNLDFDMTSVPQPQGASQAINRVTFGKAYALSVPKASKNQGGALEVALALTGSSMAPAIASSLSMAPAIRTALTPSASDRYAPVYYPQALISQGWLSPSPAATDKIFSTMISNITSGKMGVEQALGTANDAINAAL